jgi:hypothetical protein
MMPILESRPAGDCDHNLSLDLGARCLLTSKIKADEEKKFSCTEWSNLDFLQTYEQKKLMGSLLDRQSKRFIF